MKVLFQGYNTICQNKAGGMNVRIHRMKEVLEQNGVEVDFFDAFTTDISQYDIIHFFMLTYECLPMLMCAKKMNKKVVLSSVMPITGGLKIDISVLVSKLHLKTVQGLLASVAQLSDLVITETVGEAKFVCKHYGTRPQNIKVIPTGVESYSYKGRDIYQKLGKECKYILQVGRFDENKNQLNVIRALKDSDIDVVFIGGSNHGDDRYYNRCINEANESKNIHFLGWLPVGDLLLQSAYANAEVLVCPSYYETFGLSIVEGGVAGAKLAVSQTLPILEYPVFDSCRRFSPRNIKDIKDTILKTIQDDSDVELAQRIASTFSWDTVVKQHIDCYQELLQ